MHQWECLCRSDANPEMLDNVYFFGFFVYSWHQFCRSAYNRKFYTRICRLLLHTLHTTQFPFHCRSFLIWWDTSSQIFVPFLRLKECYSECPYVYKLWFECALIGTYVWVFDPQLREPFEKDLAMWHSWRRYVTGLDFEVSKFVF